MLHTVLLATASSASDGDLEQPGYVPLGDAADNIT